jgi:transcriptional regulator with XRE-family HTH domain
MQLQDWIRRNGYNYRSFADEIGVSFRNVEKWSRGKPYLDLIKLKLYLILLTMR